MLETFEQTVFSSEIFFKKCCMNLVLNKWLPRWDRKARLQSLEVSFSFPELYTLDKKTRSCEPRWFDSWPNFIPIWNRWRSRFQAFSKGSRNFTGTQKGHVFSQNCQGFAASFLQVTRPRKMIALHRSLGRATTKIWHPFPSNWSTGTARPWASDWKVNFFNGSPGFQGCYFRWLQLDICTMKLHYNCLQFCWWPFWDETVILFQKMFKCRKMSLWIIWCVDISGCFPNAQIISEVTWVEHPFFNHLRKIWFFFWIPKGFFSPKNKPPIATPSKNRVEGPQKCIVQ